FFRFLFSCFLLPIFVIISICSLLDVSDLQSDQTIRQFRHVSLAKNWSDAQTYCREKFSDLAAILNAANGTEARQAAGTSRVWIGLFNGTWKWSQDENQLSPGSSSSMFTVWSFNEPQDRKCTLLSKTGFWFAKDCGDLNEFLCYDGES
uniref:C-type lectin domain-containing protein n=1 Tax=Poecilia latipinna TaxID=48699 RepID=A0A3B3VUY8_9TELE